MKLRLSIFTAILIFAFSNVNAFANSDINIDYVVTESGITFYEKLREGLNNNFIAVTPEGDKISYNKNEVKAYRKKGREYKKLYLVEEGTTYVKEVFLERIVTKAGYTLYKKVNTENEMNLNNFYVYYKGHLEFQLSQDNHKTVLSFFFSKFNMLFAG